MIASYAIDCYNFVKQLKLLQKKLFSLYSNEFLYPFFHKATQASCTMYHPWKKPRKEHSTTIVPCRPLLLKPGELLDLIKQHTISVSSMKNRKSCKATKFKGRRIKWMKCLWKLQWGYSVHHNLKMMTEGYWWRWHRYLTSYVFVWFTRYWSFSRRINICFWATELDIDLSSSITIPAR